MNKFCELCKSPAKIYCESDEASLCWHCDFKVHSANFLVAKHLRNLLCHVCQSPTAWNASGEKLGRTISVCELCVTRREEREEAGYENEESAGDNQIVPASETSHPPAASSSSRSEEPSSSRCNGDREICLKRLRQNSLDLCSSEDDLECTSPEKIIGTPSAAARCTKTAFVDSLSRLPLKVQRTESTQSPRVHQRLAASKSEAVVLARRDLIRGPVNGEELTTIG